MLSESEIMEEKGCVGEFHDSGRIKAVVVCHLPEDEIAQCTAQCAKSAERLLVQVLVMGREALRLELVSFRLIMFSERIRILDGELRAERRESKCTHPAAIFSVLARKCDSKHCRMHPTSFGIPLLVEG